jgi:hypothetical protein
MQRVDDRPYNMCRSCLSEVPRRAAYDCEAGGLGQRSCSNSNGLALSGGTGVGFASAGIPARSRRWGQMVWVRVRMPAQPPAWWSP